jgi:hypothetical protein
METALAAFARTHLGILPRSHMFEAGFTRRQIEHLLATGRLERVYEAVYRIGGAPTSWDQRLLAACWAGGVRSYGSHRAAAVTWDLPGGEDVLDVTSPRWRRARHFDIVPHESRCLDPIDFTVVDGIIPVTRPARTIIDLCTLVARGLMRFETVELALQEAARRNLVDIALLGSRWEQLAGEYRLGTREVERLIDRWLPDAAGTDSRPENILLRLLSDAGLPAPVPQWRIWLGPGEFAVFDFAWPDQRVALEFDSYRYHGGRMKHDADATRVLKARNRGWDVLTVTDAELDSGCRQAIPALVSALAIAA